MKRADDGLPFLLKYENVAWYEDGVVRILDRRVYPELRYVYCTSHLEVRDAIKDMVTQSGGPYMAAGMGMALAARLATRAKDPVSFLQKASYELSHARVTTSKKMEEITNDALSVALDAIERGARADEEVAKHTLERTEEKYTRFGRMGKLLVDLFPSSGTVLTQCFGETVVGMMLREIGESGRDFKVMCAETRPYFQGSRLTASVSYDMGFDTTVITDNMPGYVLSNGLVDVFTSASDVITLSGDVVNKVGTMQIAMLAKHFGIPYYVTGIPSFGHEDAKSVEIEMRSPDLVLEAMGKRIAKEGVKGLYPAFDITPSGYVTSVVTDKGVFSPREVRKYYF